MRLRLKLAWHVFRGRPLVYRCHLEGLHFLTEKPDTWIIENWIEHDGLTLHYKDEK